MSQYYTVLFCTVLHCVPQYYLPFVEPLAAFASARFAQRCGELVKPLAGGGS